MANDNTEVLKNLQNFINRQLPDILEKRMEQACIYCEGEAKKNAPVDDGTLRASVSYEVKTSTNEVHGYIGTNVEYAPYVEFGTGIYAESGLGRQEVPWTYKGADGKWHTTKGQKSQPFLRPAVEDNKDKIIKFFEDAF